MKNQGNRTNVGHEDATASTGIVQSPAVATQHLRPAGLGHVIPTTASARPVLPAHSDLKRPDMWPILITGKPLNLYQWFWYQSNPYRHDIL